ncbi:MAG: metal-sensing transcriptional repressor [Rhodobacteraceae bacterium]|nr:metal-sensing transcriptional repressor [Paracoccaceae bacterium]
MSHSVHSSHPQIIARLKRAQGHLAKVIKMMEEQASCNEVAQQLHAVEKAITNAKRVLIHDHIDHCLDPEGTVALDELKSITKYL